MIYHTSHTMTEAILLTAQFGWCSALRCHLVRPVARQLNPTAICVRVCVYKRQRERGREEGDRYRCKLKTVQPNVYHTKISTQYEKCTKKIRMGYGDYSDAILHSIPPVNGMYVPVANNLHTPIRKTSQPMCSRKHIDHNPRVFKNIDIAI